PDHQHPRPRGPTAGGPGAPLPAGLRRAVPPASDRGAQAGPLEPLGRRPKPVLRTGEDPAPGLLERGGGQPGAADGGGRSAERPDHPAGTARLSSGEPRWTPLDTPSLSPPATPCGP